MQPADHQAQAVAQTVHYAGRARPKLVSLAHYGPDGATVATRGKATFDQVTHVGGTVKYEATLGSGAPHASSEVVINDKGQAQSSSVKLLRSDGQVRKLVHGDYSRLVLNPTGYPASGTASYMVAAPDGTHTHTAAMNYANERYGTYSLTAFAATESRQVTGVLEVDFANAMLAGSRLAGGMLGIKRYVGNTSALVSTAHSVLAETGMPSELLTTNYEADGKTVRNTATSDYGGVQFDARGKIDEGNLVVFVRAPTGVQTSATQYRFVNGKLFRVRRYQPGGQSSQTVAQAGGKKSPAPSMLRRPADRTHSIRRADGTLLEQRDDWFTVAGDHNSPPMTSIITTFALDGKTAVRVNEIDYRVARFAPGGQPVSGTVISTRFDGGIRSSITNIAY